jgi:2-oxo-4-hydroxy-4-carboxy-5-ureidoimidazoline decarboxylase
MILAELNALPREQFVQQLGWVFEDSPWVAERAWELRPFATAEQLCSALSRQVEQATTAEQLQLLYAHPDLGTRARMSEASAAEQGKAGLDRLTPEERETLLALNRAYREKFGFPFLFAVRGSSKHEIVAALRRRIDSNPEAELKEALGHVYRIAAFRLEEAIQTGDK